MNNDSINADLRNRFARSATPRPSCQGVRAKGPGFVVWLTSSNRKIKGFISWSETGVAELSPIVREAWHFPSLKAANDSVARGFGPVADHLGLAVFPVRDL
jgi:hypothetical protein